MRSIVCDENIGKSFVEFLSNTGYNVCWITEYSPGISDEKVLELAKNTNSILITCDKDFAQFTFARSYDLGVLVPIILLREFIFSPTLGAILVDTIRTLENSRDRCFATIKNNTVRIKKL